MNRKIAMLASAVPLAASCLALAAPAHAATPTPSPSVSVSVSPSPSPSPSPSISPTNQVRPLVSGLWGPPIGNPGGEYLNDWNSGSYVKTYTSPASNEDFVFVGVNRCNNGDYTTVNCPINGITSGLLIGQFEYTNGTCVGDLDNLTGNATAGLDGCNETGYPGTGGGYGTIFVLFPGGGCPSGSGTYLSAHWATNGSTTGLGWSGNSNGSQVYNNQTPAVCLTD
jgi:hypothetical protein